MSYFKDRAEAERWLRFDAPEIVVEHARDDEPEKLAEWERWYDLSHPDDLKRVMPPCMHAGRLRAECAYEAAAFLVETIDWMSLDRPQDAPQPTIEAMPRDLQAKIYLVARQIYDMTPNKTQMMITHRGQRCQTQLGGRTIVVVIEGLEQRLESKRGKWRCTNLQTGRTLWRTSRQLHPITERKDTT